METSGWGNMGSSPEEDALHEKEVQQRIHEREARQRVLRASLSQSGGYQKWAATRGFVQGDMHPVYLPDLTSIAPEDLDKIGAVRAAGLIGFYAMIDLTPVKGQPMIRIVPARQLPQKIDPTMPKHDPRRIVKQARTVPCVSAADLSHMVDLLTTGQV